MAETSQQGSGPLPDRYVLERELGRGGMATVYRARDLKHEREVALKVVRPDLAAAVGSERFLREIQITAGLNHPHILPLLDSGIADGLLFYVMPYVAGGSLRGLLLSDADVPFEAALRITREVASALDYAHSRGVVHRDIKPENILFNEGLAVVGDFGIARAVSTAPREKVTRTGAALGTLGYMSPEQALGTGELDSRTDVYSLGCVVYEMLVGETPASWPGPEDVKLGRLADLPPDHRRRLDRYPGRVEQVLAKALALRAGDRYGHAGDLSRSLLSASERTQSFSEDQVRQLLDRAAQLQAQAPEEDEGALTMGGVEQVAAQVGIPPEHVREAAKELNQEGAGRALQARPAQALPQQGLWRRPPEEKWDRTVFTHTVDGEIPESAFPRVVKEIQGHLGMIGHASVLAGSLTWSPATQTEETRKVVVSVDVRDGQTTIRVDETYEMRGFRKVFVGVGALSGALIAAVFAAFLGIGGAAGPGILLPFMAFGVFAGVRGTIRFEANTQRPGLEMLAARLAEMTDEEARKKELGPGAREPGPG